MTYKTCRRCMFVDIRGPSDEFLRCRQGRSCELKNEGDSCRKFGLGPWGYWIEDNWAVLAYQGKEVTRHGYKFKGSSKKAATRHILQMWATNAVTVCRTAQDIEEYQAGSNVTKWVRNVLKLDESVDPFPTPEITRDEIDLIQAKAIDHVNASVGAQFLTGGTEDLKRHKEAMEKIDQSIKERETGEVGP